mgnify:CR=1 FL=1
MEISIEYPCGYKMHVKSGIMDMFFSVEGNDKGCPIHGKDCKKKK